MGFDRELVITGVGVVSPIGIGREAFWDSLISKSSGVQPIPWLEGTKWPIRFGGEVRDFEPKKYIKPRKSMKVMCREIQLGFSSAALAIEDAALESEEVDSDRFGVVCGSEMYYGDPHDLIKALHHSKDEEGNYDERKWGPEAMPHIYPLWMLMYLPNMVACHLAIAQDARGPNNTICMGEASCLLALMEAASVIDRGLTDVMIVGGASSRLAITQLVYRGEDGLSHRNADPAAAARPYDLDRDGMVNGEGSGAIVLETREHAEARGAKPIAKLLGGFRSFAPPGSSDGLQRVMSHALEQANTNAAAISHINAEGVSGVAEDKVEAAAIRDVLGDTPVLAPKSYFGNLGGATGIVELAATLCGMIENKLPATLNYESPDPDCPVNVATDITTLDKPQALAINRSLTGQCAAVVIESCR